MAYAQDDNAQAVLVKVNQDLVVSSNEFSHISVSVSGVTPYTAVPMNPHPCSENYMCFSMELRHDDISGLFHFIVHLPCQVYSNTLWSRVVNASGMSVQRDSCGQISQVSLPLTDPLTWSGTLPAVVIGTTSYTITPASTALVVHPFALQGTVCFASIWNAQTNQCEIAATL